MEAIEEDVEVEEKEYGIDDLKGEARDNALDRLREMQYGDDWWEYTYEWWDTEKFAEHGIYGVDIDRISFDLYRDSRVEVSSGWVNAKELAVLQPDDFSNVFLQEAIRLEWLTTINFSDGSYGLSVDMGGVSFSEGEIEASVFAGMDIDMFNTQFEQAMEPLYKCVVEHVKAALREFLSDLRAESDYLESEECLVEQANGNDWKFDEEGNML